MTKLISISPVGKNGQAVVPISVRRMFRLNGRKNMIGFYLRNNHVEIAPVSLTREELNYSEA